MVVAAIIRCEVSFAIIFSDYFLICFMIDYDIRGTPLASGSRLSIRMNFPNNASYEMLELKITYFT